MVRASSFIYRSSIGLLFGALALGVLACKTTSKGDEETRSKYGDPVGIRMDAEGGVPAYEMAIALSQGVEVEPLVPRLAGTLHRAIKACPAVLARPEVATQIHLLVREGRIGSSSAPSSSEEPCLKRALDKAAIDTPGSFDAIVQLRLFSQAEP